MEEAQGEEGEPSWWLVIPHASPQLTNGDYLRLWCASVISITTPLVHLHL
jgi:hypothetical protein